jgi:hypothetical protein
MTLKMKNWHFLILISKRILIHQRPFEVIHYMYLPKKHKGEKQHDFNLRKKSQKRFAKYILVSACLLGGP